MRRRKTYEETSIEAENTFKEVNYPQDTVKVTMLSNEILYSVPGTYDVLYWNSTVCRRLPRGLTAA